MYTINDVPLMNPTYGWRLLRRSQMLTGVTKNLASVTIPGRHGVLSGIPAFRGAPSKTIVVQTPGEHLETLIALFEQNNGVGYLALEDDSTRNALFELQSIDAQGVNAADELINVTVVIRLPSGAWRSTSRTVMTPEDISTGGSVQTFEILAGISSDITDMDIYIGGAFGNFELKDEGSGSWLKTVQTWPGNTTNGLLYVGATGQAFLVDDDTPWTPGADRSQYVDVSGGGGFRITPVAVDGDPSDRIAKLKLTTTSQSGLEFGFRAYNAYAVRKGDI